MPKPLHAAMETQEAKDNNYLERGNDLHVVVKNHTRSDDIVSVEYGVARVSLARRNSLSLLIEVRPGAARWKWSVARAESNQVESERIAPLRALKAPVSARGTIPERLVRGSTRSTG